MSAKGRSALGGNYELRIMKYKKIIYWGLFVIISIAIIFIAIGWWPVATVNGSVITFAQFSKNYDIAVHFYQSELKLGQKDISLLNTEKAKTEMRQAVLESAIENELIDKELKKQLSDGDLVFMISEKINKVDLSSENFKKGVEMLYGLSPDDFRELILMPKAKEEILQGRLFLKDSSQISEMDGWLKEEKIKAKVFIFIPGLFWSKDGVNINK